MKLRIYYYENSLSQKIRYENFILRKFEAIWYVAIHIKLCAVHRK